MNKNFLRGFGGLAALASVALGLAAVSSPAGAAGTPQSQVPSAVPAYFTPNVKDGTVFTIASVGTRVILGGDFTQAAKPGGAVVTRRYVLAFNASNGAIDNGFVPVLDGAVQDVTPGPSPDTVYVSGVFTTVNGVKSRNIALLSTVTGAIVSGFKSPTPNGGVTTAKLVGRRVIIGGNFTTVSGSQRLGLASLSATTGVLDSYVTTKLTGHHNYTGQPNQALGAVGVKSLDVSPDGRQLVAVGNFKTADGAPHDQVAMLTLGSASATLNANWNTLQFSGACHIGSFDAWIRDVQFSPDSAYFVIVASGGSGTNTDGTRALCDSASRWESSAAGNNLKPTWIDWTGQDSLWSVAVTGAAVYVGGHQRWLNNSYGYDKAGAGAVPRPGLAAIDPVSGVPLSWNPGRQPRGAGAYALYATSTGLYVGSDTSYIGNFAYYRQRIAYFPLAGGSTPASTAVRALPANVYSAAPTGGLAARTGILYRVNAGGPPVGTTDNGPDWDADAGPGDPGYGYHGDGSSTSSTGSGVALSSSVPAGTPATLFNDQRFDPGYKNDGKEMHWSFPVPAGTSVAVQLYYSNHFSGTSQPGQRVFDVAIDGVAVQNKYDIVADVGDKTGSMKSFTVTSPASGRVTIDFTHEVNNPLVDAIEIVRADAPTSPAPAGELSYRGFDGTTAGGQTGVSTPGIDWSTTRGAFVVGNTLFYGTTGGTFHRASFDGRVGTSSAVDPYNDPAWADVNTGSGQTYKGVPSSFYSEIVNLSGAFYSQGRLFYTQAGRSTMNWRWFSPDSGTVGATEFQVDGGNFVSVAGTFFSGSTLYYASKADGTLHATTLTGTTVSGGDPVVSGPGKDGVDWRARSLFTYGAPDAS